MIEKHPVLLKLGVAIAFLAAMLATYGYAGDDWRLFLITVFSLAVIALVDQRERRLFPILLIFLGIRTLELLFSFLLTQMLGLPYLLLTGLVDFLFAFLLVHYSQEPTLGQLCKVTSPIPRMPQLHWIAILLGISCFYRVAAAVELVLHEMDRNFFGGEIPFFFETGPIAMMVLRIAIDVMLWSMLLFPRKFSQFGQYRPRNLSS